MLLTIWVGNCVEVKMLLTDSRDAGLQKYEEGGDNVDEGSKNLDSMRMGTLAGNLTEKDVDRTRKD